MIPKLSPLIPRLLITLLLSLSMPSFAGLGDVAPLGNPDGKVTVADALVTLRMGLNLIPAELNADVAPLNNPDGNVSVADALVTLRAGLGLIEINSVDLSVTPSLGMVVHAKVIAYQADGVTPLGEGTTNAEGLVTFFHSGNYAGPIVLAVLGGNGAQYFDEATGEWIDFVEGDVLHALVHQSTGAWGVTPYTEIAYQTALSLGLINQGSHISDVAVNTLNERVRNAFLPELADILTPARLLSARPDAGAGALGTTQADIYALRLAALSELSHTLGTDLISFTHKLADDIIDDGLINRSGLASNLPYLNNFSDDLFSAVKSTATYYAASDLNDLIHAADSLFDDVTNRLQFTDVTNAGGTALVPSGTGTALLGARGATGTVNASVYTYTTPSYLTLPTNVMFYDAFDGDDVLTRWTINGFSPFVGRQVCGGTNEAPYINLTVGGVVYHANECELYITSVGFDRIEGRFAAKLKDINGDDFGTVTDGYFRYTPSGTVSYDFGDQDGLDIIDAAAGNYQAYVWKTSHPNQSIGSFTFNMSRVGDQGRVTGIPVSITTDEPQSADGPFAIVGDLTDIFAAGFLKPSTATVGAYRFVFTDILNGASSANMTVYIHPTGLIEGTYTDETGRFQFTTNQYDRYALTPPVELTTYAESYQAEGYFFIQGPFEFRVADTGQISYTDPLSCELVNIDWDGNGDYVTRYANNSISVRMENEQHLIHLFADNRGIWEFRIGEANGTNIYRTTTPSTGNFGDFGLSLCQAQANDATPPMMTPPENMTFDATDNNGTARSQSSLNQYLSGITAIDRILSWEVNVAVTHDAPNQLPLGDTLVTFTATDIKGNQSTRQATITIRDLSAPVINAPESITLAAQDGFGSPKSASVIQDFITSVTANDNIDGAVSVSNNIPEQLSYGNNTVTFEATDALGHIAQVTTVMNLIDLTPPQLTPPAETIVAAINADGTHIDADDVKAFIESLGITDNRDTINFVQIAHDLPDTFPMGDITVTFTVTDRANNQATTSAILTVADITAPVITLEGGSLLSLFQNTPFNDPGATAMDNVDGNITQAISASTLLDTSTLGDHTVTYSVTDAAGNIGSIQRVVNIIDTLPPPDWRSISPALSASVFNRTLYTGSLFVIVGNSGVILSSVDGKTWVQRASGTAYNLVDVIWDGSQLIAVGGGSNTSGNKQGILITSSDGSNWSSPKIISDSPLMSVVYGNDKYLVSDTASHIYESNDLTDWIKQQAVGQGLNRMIWDGTFYIGVADNQVRGDYTGQGNWPLKVTGTTQLNDILNANGKILLAGNGNTLVDYTGPGYYFNYNLRTERFTDTANYNGLAWNGTEYLLVGSVGTVYSSLTASNREWTPHDTGNSTANYTSVSASPDTTVIIGSGSEIISSDDLSDWIDHNPNAFTGSINWYGIANGVHMVKTSACEGVTICLWTSSDLINWNKEVFASTEFKMTSDGDTFYRWYNSAARYTSTDGTTWSDVDYVTNPAFFSHIVAIKDGIWIYGQFDGNVGVSFDKGVSWANYNAGLGAQPINNIVKIGDELFALGSAGGISSSSDGINWTARTTDSSWQLWDLASDGNKMVAVGYNPSFSSVTGFQSEILTSVDNGMNWSRQMISGSRLTRVVHAGTHWVTTSTHETTALASPEGNIWSAIPGFPSSPSTWIDLPQVGNKTFVIGSQSLSVLEPLE